MNKTITKRIWGMIRSCIILIFLYFAVAFLGNPISWILAKSASSRYLQEFLPNTDFVISNVSYNFKTGGYYAYIDSPSSQDRYFTIYFDGLGRYSYDTYENITSCTTTYRRLNDEYRNLVKSRIAGEDCPFEFSIAFGDLKRIDIREVYNYVDENGVMMEYFLDKEYGMELDALILDGKYNIYELGQSYGRLCIYIHDPDVSVKRAAELLVEVKNYLNRQEIPFHAIDFHLCEPRNEEGQLTGNQISLFDFLSKDIYEQGLTARVQSHWDIAREHYAIQDGIKNQSVLLDPK